MATLPAVQVEHLLSAIPSLPRHILDRLVTSLIDHLDDLDGDIDAESNGDELDGSMVEDDFHDQSANGLGHAGCPVSDPGGCEHDGREPEDWAFMEPPSCPPAGARKSREAHVRRIRGTRCLAIRRRHFLMREPKVPTLNTMRRRNPQLRRKRRS